MGREARDSIMWKLHPNFLFGGGKDTPWESVKEKETRIADELMKKCGLGTQSSSQSRTQGMFLTLINTNVVWFLSSRT